jgi:hypothetical protein
VVYPAIGNKSKHSRKTQVKQAETDTGDMDMDMDRDMDRDTGSQDTHRTRDRR